MEIDISVEYLNNYDLENWGKLIIHDYGLFNLKIAISKNCNIMKNETVVLRTGVILLPPVGYVINITPVPTISASGIILTNTPFLVYNYYRKEICLIAENIKTNITLKPGHVIAQARVSKIVNFNLITSSSESGDELRR